MTPEQAAHETRHGVVLFTAGFMMGGDAFTRGTELGFEGFDFYAAGRGGVLGDVPADVVVAAFVFFAPDTVRAAWERSANVMSRRQAAEEWAATAHAWARTNLDDTTDWARIAELAGRIVTNADVAGAPLFAGWRTLPEPEPGDAKALAIHRLNALRELRGGLHGAAVLTVGLTPFEACSVLAPQMVSVMGWTEAAREPEPLRDRWQLAEARTDRMLGKHFAALDEVERKEFVDLLGNDEPMTWLRAATEGFDATFSLRPNANARFRELYDGLWNGGVDGDTLDACEARIASLVQVAPDPTAGLSLTEAQRAAVDYAEQYTLDPHGLRDEDFDRLHQFYDDAQLATLTLAVAMFDARARFSVALEV